ncbi:MAG: hypothetical protein HFI90_05480 [Clostridia bacterium]|nr:hypothetical protein [Clostridia bacterium]
MERDFLKQLILPEFVASAQECGECEYKLKENTPEVYAAKQNELQEMLLEAAKKPMDVERMLETSTEKLFPKENESRLIDETGRFADLEDTPQGALIAVQRLAWLSQDYHPQHGQKHLSQQEKTVFLRAVVHYCKIEADREDLGRSRFHASIFCFPKCAVQLFHVFLPDMLAVERGENGDAVTAEAYRQLLRICMQAWTLPQRGDHTDAHPISPERFRKHVWWVGANAVCYRPLFRIALVLRSVEMMDTLMFVATHILTPVSAATVDTAFWSEGICADGFGWGHGRQTYNTGYPTQGIISGLEIMKELTHTPWEQELQGMDFSWVLHYMNGITWGDYNGWNAPMQSRHIFKQGENIHAPCSGTQYALQIATLLKEHFFHLLQPAQQQEVDALLQTGTSPVPNYPAGQYEGVRYFWNNDDLICKTPDYYWFVNMASARCDGVECAHEMADMRNSFLCDGSYVVLRRGDEYAQALGTWQMGMLPGITSRELTNAELLPETNWRGYHSKFNFAGGVTCGLFGAAGFIFEKERTKEPEAEEAYTKEMMGVQAYKSYFAFGDTFVCLGAGVCDVMPEYKRGIRTTINHTGRHTDVLLMDETGTVLEKVEDKKLLSLNKHYAVWQDGILYGIMAADEPETKLEICADMRKTNWAALNIGNAEVTEKEVPVFTMALLHGENPRNSGYAYWMYCGQQDAKAYVKQKPFRVLQNTTAVQAVETQDGNMLQAIVYETGTICSGTKWRVQVNGPAVLMLEETEAGILLTVCDPCQDVARETMELMIQKEGKETQTVVVHLPSGAEVGKPVAVQVKNA